MEINLKKFYKAFEELDRLFRKHLVKYDHDSMGEQRGVAVFVSSTEPENPQTNDIWIKI